MDEGNRDITDSLIKLNEKLLKVVEQLIIRADPAVSPFLSKSEIQKIMEWSSAQFRYRIETLKHYGLILDGNQFKMPFNGFKLYLDSLDEEHVSHFYND